MSGFFENLANKCMNSQKQYVTGSDYEIIINENKSLKTENEKFKNLINLYQREIEILKIQNNKIKNENKKLKEDNTISI